MPPALPSELLLEIFELALPSSETVSESAEREKTLFSLCLVSHQFRDIAQPLLWRIFRPEKNHLHLAASSPRLFAHVRVFQPKYFVTSFPPLVKAASQMSHLVAFHCAGNADISETQLRQLKDVQHLHLHNVVAPSFSSVVFRNLVSLAVHGLPRPVGSTAALLPSWSLPSLKALYTTCEHYNGSTGRTELVEPIGLGDQLDMLQVFVLSYRTFPSDLPDRDTTVLVVVADYCIEYGSFSAVSRFQHFQLNAWNEAKEAGRSNRRRTPKQTLQQLLQTVASHAYMRSLSLPSRLHTSSPLESELAATRDDLLTTCVSRGIDIIWRLESKEPDDDKGVSRDFWRYAKGLKKKKALEAEGGA
ncbi:hypothetical protein JCM8547_002734 [Rhodosporidiobolus lusitaniae]